MLGFGRPNIGKLKEKNDVKGLIKALEYNKEYYVRELAAKALGEIRDPHAVEPLIKALSDCRWEVRIEAVKALGNTKDQRVVEPLIKALSDCRWDVCSEAAKVLGNIKDQRAVEPLIKVLEHIHNTAVVETLGEIGDQRAVEPLIKALNSGDGYFSWKVATALEKIGWKPSNDEIAAQYWIIKHEWDKCVEIGSPAVESLIKILNKKDVNDSVDIFNKRTEAIESLGKIGNQRAVEALIQILNDSNIYIRRNAAAALSNALGSACPPGIGIGHSIRSLGVYKTDTKCGRSFSRIQVRRTAAEALIKLYKDEKIDPNVKTAILSTKVLITTPHQDEIIHKGASDCTEYHEDYGIGLDFPL